MINSKKSFIGGSFFGDSGNINVVIVVIVVVVVVIVHCKPPDKPPLDQGPSPSPAAQIQPDDYYLRRLFRIPFGETSSL